MAKLRDQTNEEVLRSPTLRSDTWYIKHKRIKLILDWQLVSNVEACLQQQLV